MTVTTYGELQTAIVNWTDTDPGMDRVREFIELGEARINRLIRALDMEIRATATLSGDRLGLPAGFKSLVRLELLTSPRTKPDFTAPHALPVISSGPVRYFTIENGEFRFAPGGSSDIEIVYHGDLPALSDTNTTNFFLNDHPDVYLAAALAHAQGYNRDDPNAAEWKALWDEGVLEIRREERRKKRANMVVKPPVDESVGLTRRA